MGLLLALGCSVMALDFAGAGLSDGSVVTLGYREGDDVVAAIEYLRGDARVSQIAGWGSSAGAAALLFCMACGHQTSLACCVLDGPYADVRQVAAELAERSTVGGYSAPWPVAQAVLALLDSSVQERAGVTLNDLRPVAHAPRCRAPALFLHATGDALLGAQHTEALARAYGGPRVLADVEGTHSSPRNQRALDYCGAFLRERLQLDAAPATGRVDRVPWE